MTNKEIIEGLEIVKSECGKYLDEGFAWICQPIDAAIKALEREEWEDAINRKDAVIVPMSVIESIKAEIEKEKVCKIKGYNAIGSKSQKGFDMGLLRALRIIDKHISGKEEYIPASALKDEIDKIDDIEVFNGKVYVRVSDVFKILDRHISEVMKCED